MAISFDKALGVHEQALQVRTARAELIANNLANSDTPNYKAKDIDFRQVLQDQTKLNAPSQITPSRTHEGHQSFAETAAFPDAMKYRNPMQPSIDGNTVDEHVEHAAFMENALAFQTSFTFLNSRFKGLMTAVRGE